MDKPGHISYREGVLFSISVRITVFTNLPVLIPLAIPVIFYCQNKTKTVELKKNCSAKEYLNLFYFAPKMTKHISKLYTSILTSNRNSAVPRGR